MKDENERPLAQWTISHILGFLGIAGAGVGGWVVLNERVARVESNTDAITENGREYRAETTRRLERIEENQTKLMMAFGVKPEE